MKAGKRGNSDRRPARRRFQRQPSSTVSKRGLFPAGPDELTDRLVQAQRLVDNERWGQALTLVEPLAAAIAATDRNRYLFSRRLLALACSQTGRFEEAERYAGEGLVVCPEALDFPFLLAITAARAGKYDEALRFGRQYLDCWPAAANAPSETAPWNLTIDQRHQLLNAYGVALLERGRPEEAESAFREAIALCPGFDSSHINLARMYAKRGRTEEARAAAAAGLQQAPESIPLRRLAEADRKRPTISVCMIVKDEEILLPRCLRSVQPLADEIIVVDTGSTDRTREIARDFGALVFEFPWQGDFSSARNESIRHATKDWIFIIDADEELPAEDLPAIRFSLDQSDIRIISLSVYNRSLETGQVSSFLPSTRLFRRDLNLRYYGIVHNRLTIPPETPITRCPARVFHYGYDLSADVLEKKKARTRALLEKQLADHPDDLYANFNMAQLLRGFRDADSEEVSRAIMDHAGRVIGNPESKTPRYFGQRLMSLHQMATALYALKRYEEAERYCREALEAKPGYLDPIMTLGHIHLAAGRLNDARTCYLRYLETRAAYRAEDETDNVILLYLDGVHVAWYGLGLIAEKERAVAEAIRCYRQTLAARAPYLDCYLRLGRLSLDNHDPIAAEAMFRNEAERDERSAWAWFGLGEALSQQGRDDQGVDYFRRAVDLAPDDHQMLFRLGKTRIRLGETAAGVNDLNRAARMNAVDASFLLETADCLFAAGSYDDAAGIYRRVLEHNSDCLQARVNLGNCLFKTGDLPGACALYRMVLGARPDHLPACRNLGLAEARLGQIAASTATLEQYIEMNPLDPQIVLLLGDLHASQGDERAAVGWYEKYLRLRPRDEAGLVRLSESYLRQGFTEAAGLGFRKALEMNPDCASARAGLAEIEAAAGLVSS